MSDDLKRQVEAYRQAARMLFPDVRFEPRSQVQIAEDGAFIDGTVFVSAAALSQLKPQKVNGGSDG